MRGRLIRVLLSAAASIPSASAAAKGGAEAAVGDAILVQHVGFLPRAAKYCLVPGRERRTFRVVDAATGEEVHRGTMVPFVGDLGDYLVGRFSELEREGTYRIRSGSLASGRFRIAAGVYDDGLAKMIRYFRAQRCGATNEGWRGEPCHLDDGRRLGDGRHQDVSGGWHDACDLRKWVRPTIYGMIGLSEVAGRLPPGFDPRELIDELRWGNRYFLAMQEPPGYVMDHVGGDVFQHADSNRWTDNVAGTGDDRIIVTRPCAAEAQFCFVIAQCAVARVAGAPSPYAARCREAALRCHRWAVEGRIARTATQLGLAIAASIALYDRTGERTYAERAAALADRLLSLQVREAGEPCGVSGFFRTSREDPEPAKEILHGHWPLIGLCELARALPGHPKRGAWLEGVRRYSRDYLLAMASRSPFGIVPYGLFSRNPGGNRRIGGLWYRWFMWDEGWWVGVNANLASAGVGLLKAAALLGDGELAALAQRQLDWILGVNPFDASTVTGVGRNQPPRMVASEFVPPTPAIPGGVMNGIGGTRHDLPYLGPGEYHTTEYWTPMVGTTMWLVAELEAYGLRDRG